MAGVERRIEPVMRSLADPSVGRLVLFSLRSGTGKTWTARHAMRRAVDSRLFDIAVWVPLSSNSDLRAAQRMIAANLSIPVAGDDGRHEIHSFLDGKKFLMIFDDAWFTEDDALDLIGVPGPNSECLSKVLVTTRSSRTLSVLEPAVVIEPTPLSHKESWSLFSEKAGRPVTSPEVRPLVQAVIDRCAGSPLAIVLVAASMQYVGDLMLPSALENAVWELDYSENRAVKFGYDTLPRDSMRDCFLYCLLFGENRSIDAAELVRYWVSEGFIQEYDYLDEAYENGRKVLVELVNRCLLDMEDDDHVHMHDVVTEEAASIGTASGKAYFVKVDMELGRLPSSYSWRNIERMSLIDNKITELPEIPASHSLATLLLKGNHSLRSIPDEFFSQMKGLRVLDLSYTAIERLPPSISELVELRSLLLRGCNSLEEVQHIDVLEKLEILDLSSATSLKTIPYNSCRRMYLLKVLNLSGTAIESLQFLLNLRELRHLYLSHCRLLSSELLQFDFLTKLEVLDLSGTSLLRFPYWMTRLTRLRRLKLGGTEDAAAFDWKALEFLPKDFNWHQYGGSDVSIELVGNDGEACITVSSADFFRSLDKDSQLWRTCFQKFHFYVCPCMDNDIRFQLKNFALRDTYFESRHFPNSAKPDRYLEVCNLDSYSGGIEGVLQHAELVFLNNNMFMNRLSDLGLENMEVMKECWIERCDRSEIVLSGQDVQVIAAIGRLEKLWVSNLENLRHLCGEMERPVSLACLKHLHIDCCPELTSLFSSALHLENLETLGIKFCDKLETVFEESVEGNVVLPRLRTLRLWELPQLKSLCQGFLPSVKMIRVKECPKLKKLPLDAENIRPLVEIRGEREWWNSLVWEDGRTVCALHFRRGII